jgi:hypothetical protein
MFPPYREPYPLTRLGGRSPLKRRIARKLQGEYSATVAGLLLPNDPARSHAALRQVKLQQVCRRRKLRA